MRLCPLVPRRRVDLVRLAEAIVAELGVPRRLLLAAGVLRMILAAAIAATATPPAAPAPASIAEVLATLALLLHALGGKSFSRIRPRIGNWFSVRARGLGMRRLGGRSVLMLLALVARALALGAAVAIAVTIAVASAAPPPAPVSAALALATLFAMLLLARAALV